MKRPQRGPQYNGPIVGVSWVLGLTLSWVCANMTLLKSQSSIPLKLERCLLIRLWMLYTKKNIHSQFMAHGFSFNNNPTLYLFMIITTLYDMRYKSRNKIAFISELCFVVCQQIVIYSPYTKRSCVSNMLPLKYSRYRERELASPLILFARSILLHSKA